MRGAKYGSSQHKQLNQSSQPLFLLQPKKMAALQLIQTIIKQTPS
jgi:hypothetical protein